MTRQQAAIRLAHILGIGTLAAEALVLIAERDSRELSRLVYPAKTPQHAWKD